MEQITRDRLDQICRGEAPKSTCDLVEKVTESVVFANGGTYFPTEVLALIHEIASLREELAGKSKKSSAKKKSPASKK